MGPELTRQQHVTEVVLVARIRFFKKHGARSLEVFDMQQGITVTYKPGGVHATLELLPECVRVSWTGFDNGPVEMVVEGRTFLLEHSLLKRLDHGICQDALGQWVPCEGQLWKDGTLSFSKLTCFLSSSSQFLDRLVT
jgi:hypothetical protein